MQRIHLESVVYLYSDNCSITISTTAAINATSTPVAKNINHLAVSLRSTYKDPLRFSSSIYIEFSQIS